MFSGRSLGDSVAGAATRVSPFVRLCLALVLVASSLLPAFGAAAHARGLSTFAASGARATCSDRAPDAPTPVERGRETHFCMACVACQVGGAALAASPVIEIPGFSGATEPKRKSTTQFDKIRQGALGWSSRAPPHFF